MQKTDSFLEKCATEYPVALSVYEKIVQTTNTALAQNNHELLLALLPYMESGEGYLSFQYIGEARRLLRILHIIELEEKYHTNSFIFQINNKQELIEKYMLSLFSLRRIAFALSPESIADAEYYLEQNQLSPFAIYILAKEELLPSGLLLFQRILNLYQLQWNQNEKQLFQKLTSTLTETS